MKNYLTFVRERHDRTGVLREVLGVSKVDVQDNGLSRDRAKMSGKTTIRSGFWGRMISVYVFIP